jgi:cephalosporin hydroxylase
MSTLRGLCKKYYKNGWPDRDTTHSYIDIYEKILSPYAADDRNNILEIGIMSGESLKMWADYFAGTVFGMDCSETPIDGIADLRPLIAAGTHNIFIGDASDPDVINEFFSGIDFDVIIEDASHEINQQLQMYRTLKPYLAEGAIYIIEDIADIDVTRPFFENIDTEKHVEILDRRHLKGRFDDVICIIRDKP